MSTVNPRGNMNVVVVGNCQSRPIASILQKVDLNINVTIVAVVHLLKSDQYGEYINHFQDADFIITQLLADNYPCDFVRTKYLKEKFGAKVITIVNLYYSGYHPDWLYIKLPSIGMIKGPIGDYHNKTIFKCWQNNQSSKLASELIEDYEYNTLYAKDRVQSLLELKTREANVDIKITDFIEKHQLEYQLFFTFNHPIQRLIFEYVSRILTYMNLKAHKPDSIMANEPLGMFRPMVNPISRTMQHCETLHQGVRFPALVGQPQIVTRYSSREVADIFYTIYDQHAESALHLEIS